MSKKLTIKDEYGNTDFSGFRLAGSFITGPFPRPTTDAIVTDMLTCFSKAVDINAVIDHPIFKDSGVQVTIDNGTIILNIPMIFKNNMVLASYVRRVNIIHGPSLPGFRNIVMDYYYTDKCILKVLCWTTLLSVLTGLAINYLF